MDGIVLRAKKEPHFDEALLFLRVEIKACNTLAG